MKRRDTLIEIDVKIQEMMASVDKIERTALGVIGRARLDGVWSGMRAVSDVIAKKIQEDT